ncbi:hypothetical protein C8F01DRAFT_1079459 [Mycena amicta]|nr:hypothetical protein C8F01DRAFT_1079459 [Mycena amicta]
MLTESRDCVCVTMTIFLLSAMTTPTADEAQLLSTAARIRRKLQAAAKPEATKSARHELQKQARNEFAREFFKRKYIHDPQAQTALRFAPIFAEYQRICDEHRVKDKVDQQTLARQMWVVLPNIMRGLDAKGRKATYVLLRRRTSTDAQHPDSSDDEGDEGDGDDGSNDESDEGDGNNEGDERSAQGSAHLPGLHLLNTFLAFLVRTGGGEYLRHSVDQFGRQLDDKSDPDHPGPTPESVPTALAPAHFFPTSDSASSIHSPPLLLPTHLGLKRKSAVDASLDSGFDPSLVPRPPKKIQYADQAATEDGVGGGDAYMYAGGAYTGVGGVGGGDTYTYAGSTYTGVGGVGGGDAYTYAGGAYTGVGGGGDAYTRS